MRLLWAEIFPRQFTKFWRTCAILCAPTVCRVSTVHGYAQVIICFHFQRCIFSVLCSDNRNTAISCNCTKSRCQYWNSLPIGSRPFVHFLLVCLSLVVFLLVLSLLFRSYWFSLLCSSTFFVSFYLPGVPLVPIIFDWTTWFPCSLLLVFVSLSLSYWFIHSTSIGLRFSLPFLLVHQLHFYWSPFLSPSPIGSSIPLLQVSLSLYLSYWFIYSTSIGLRFSLSLLLVPLRPYYWSLFLSPSPIGSSNPLLLVSISLSLSYWFIYSHSYWYLCTSTIGPYLPLPLLLVHLIRFYWSQCLSPSHIGYSAPLTLVSVYCTSFTLTGATNSLILVPVSLFFSYWFIYSTLLVSVSLSLS